GQPIISPSQDIVMGCYYLTADPMVTLDRLGRGDGEEPRGKKAAAADPRYVNLVGEGMVFASPAEVFLAYAEKRVGVHARIQVRLPIGKRVISEVRYDKDKVRVEEVPRLPNGLVKTTVGRVLFNDILKPQMAYYDLALSGKYLSRIIADC